MSGGASASGASDALDIGPSSGYSLNLSLLVHVVYDMFIMPCLYMHSPASIFFLVYALCSLCSYAFDRMFVLYMIYEFADMNNLSWYDPNKYVHHVNYLHIILHDAMSKLLIIFYVIITKVLIFWINLTWKLPKYVTLGAMRPW